ncbi:LOW QUALITY PROTEIN: hypothetical protein KUTeg_022542 [Tegillarca granosa]|uniref:Uncharacterized protein n=1 Tax=Tegillarca granosa TaxID=220873 RepID=A0ABQ9E6J6_TEGGR|nr:LOW QUALITY PROTEIN: hypothetical protein KUTeg_022542 [Tegillarca granosa]
MKTRFQLCTRHLVATQTVKTRPYFIVKTKTKRSYTSPRSIRTMRRLFLIDLEPRLMLLAKDQLVSYRGQTALHIAITKAKATCERSIKTDIICKPATGDRFVNTVMMGSLPLSVAALKFKTEMVDLLFYHGAEINSPSLKHFDNTDTMYYRYESTYVWFLYYNNEGLTPFQLTASHDIDTVSKVKATIAIKSSSLQYQHKVVPSRVEGIYRKGLTSNVRCLPCTSGECRYPPTPSILEMMYNYRLDDKSVIRIINLTPIKDIIKAKWSAYSLVFFIWMFLHIFLFLITLTAFCVVRADMYEAMESNTSFSSVQTTLVNAYHWLGVVIGVIYATISILLIVAKFRKPLPLIYNIWHNLQYITLLLVFSVLLISDSLIHGISGKSDSILLILALIAGRKIPSENDAGILVPDDNFDGYFATMLTMFKLMLGLGDIEILYEAKIPGLAIAHFIAFIILTYVLMISALITMMSKTCALVLEDIYPHWRFINSPGEEKSMKGYDPETKQNKSQLRYFLEIHSLQMEYATDEDRDAFNKKRGRESPFRTLHIPPGGSDYFDLTMSRDLTERQGKG